jgi:hypothetical protein
VPIGCPGETQRYADSGTKCDLLVHRVKFTCHWGQLDPAFGAAPHDEVEILKLRRREN